MSSRTILVVLQFSNYCFNNVIGGQKHTQMLPVSSQELSQFKGIQSAYEYFQLGHFTYKGLLRLKTGILSKEHIPSLSIYCNILLFDKRKYGREFYLPIWYPEEYFQISFLPGRLYFSKLNHSTFIIFLLLFFCFSQLTKKLLCRMMTKKIFLPYFQELKMSHTLTIYQKLS